MFSEEDVKAAEDILTKVFWDGDVRDATCNTFARYFLEGVKYVRQQKKKKRPTVVSNAEGLKIYLDDNFTIEVRREL